MRSWVRALVVVGLAMPAVAQARTFEVSLLDGRVLLATAVSGDPAGSLEVQVGGATTRLAGASVLGVQGCAVQPLDLPSAWLVGGEVCTGLLAGGDAVGDHVDVLSPSLGRLVLPVDRLQALLVTPTVRLESLPLPNGVGEALFQRAAIGYDVLAGSLHQFSERGVRFQPAGEAAPRWFRPQDLVALRIADGVARPKPAAAWLATRTGDRLGVDVQRFTGDGVQCGLENGATVLVRYGDLASLSFLGRATFLSDLQPKEVVESGFDGDVVHPWQRDRSAVGTALVAGERTHGKGLGVHSRSRLVFVVPPGHASFWTRVALDDGAAALPFRAQADVRVLVNDQLRFEHKGLEPGQPPRDAGRVPVAPGDRVALEVDFGKGRDLGDRVDWLSAVFLRGGKEQ